MAASRALYELDLRGDKRAALGMRSPTGSCAARATPTRSCWRSRHLSSADENAAAIAGRCRRRATFAWPPGRARRERRFLPAAFGRLQPAAPPSAFALMLAARRAASAAASAGTPAAIRRADLVPEPAHDPRSMRRPRPSRSLTRRAAGAGYKEGRRRRRPLHVDKARSSARIDIALRDLDRDQGPRHQRRRPARLEGSAHALGRHCHAARNDIRLSADGARCTPDAGRRARHPTPTRRRSPNTATAATPCCARSGTARRRCGN